MSLASIPFPIELVAVITEHAGDAGDTRTVAAIARTSRALNDIATPILYRRLVLTRRNGPRLFRGLPRAAERKSSGRTKAQYNADLEIFSRKFSGLLKGFAEGQEPPDDETDEDAEDDGNDGEGDWLDAEWDDSDPETDDELSPDWSPGEEGEGEPADQDEPHDRDAAWARRRELLGLCEHLTVFQVPSRPLLEDLMDVGNYGSDEEDHEEGDDTDPAVFPKLTHLAIGLRVLRYAGDYYARMAFENPEHDFLYFMKHAFGNPKHICMTCPPDPTAMPPVHVMRLFHKRAENIQDREVRYVLFQGVYGTNYLGTCDMRAQLISTWLPPRAETLTVHNLRYPGPRDGQGLTSEAELGIPFLEENHHRHTTRVFYDDGGDKGDGAQDVSERVETILEALSKTAPSHLRGKEGIEHIDVGNNISDQADRREAEEDIRTQVGQRIAADPSKYTRQNVPFESWMCLPQDHDEALNKVYSDADAAHAAMDSRYKQALVEIRGLRDELRKLPEASPATKQEGADVHADPETRASLKPLGDRTEAFNGSTSVAGPTGAQSTSATPQAELELKISEMEQAVRATRVETEALKRAVSDARAAALEARMANLKVRLEAEALENQVPPEDRITFSSGDEAAPCVVCWRRHTSADPQGLRAQVELAWARGGVAAV